MIEDVLRWHHRHPPRLAGDLAAAGAALERALAAWPSAPRSTPSSTSTRSSTAPTSCSACSTGAATSSARSGSRCGPARTPTATPPTRPASSAPGRGAAGSRSASARGIAYGRRFPFTDYTLRRAIRVNLRLAAELTRAARRQHRCELADRAEPGRAARLRAVAAGSGPRPGPERDGDAERRRHGRLPGRRLRPRWGARRLVVVRRPQRRPRRRDHAHLPPAGHLPRRGLGRRRPRAHLGCASSRSRSPAKAAYPVMN